MLKTLLKILSFPAFVLAAWFVPFDRLPSMCLFLHMTGYPCPTCGITRSVTALARLDFDLAMRMNPLGPTVVGVFGLWWVIAVYQLAAGRRTRLAEWAGSNVALLAIIGCVILFFYGGVRIWLLAR